MQDNNDAVLASKLEYLSLNPLGKILYKIKHFFLAIPKACSRFFRAIPSKARKQSRQAQGVFHNIYEAGRYGDVFTRLSFLIMGFGLFFRHQIIRGALYLAYEIFFVFFMILIGGPALRGLSSLGQLGSVTYRVVDPVTGLDLDSLVNYDDSFTILLYSVISIVLILILVALWYSQLKDSLRLQREGVIGKRARDVDTIKNVFDKSYHRTLLSIPMFGLVCFTIIPIVVMILVAFTNYNQNHLTPGRLFDWVGMYNFENLFSSGSGASKNIFLQVFGEVLLWTLIWAFFATFSNYFLGMIVAMIINIKGIKLKKVWRTVLITTIAVPQFISLLLISRMFGDNGFINNMLLDWGWIDAPVRWLSDQLIAKVMIIVINTWVGIPYTMLISTGLLMNIPDDLYESARIDGASPVRMYFKITLPYMLFVTTPYLISQFVGNINNFNVIYLLSGGNPAFYFEGTSIPLQVSATGVGRTDLLITWLYKMTVTSPEKDYGTGSVIGILIFVVVAFFSLIFYNRSGSVKNEEEFQ